MTMPSPSHRNRTLARWQGRLGLAVVLVSAVVLRLDGVDFGLPALNDPDEPLFVMTAMDMLRTRTLNPGWFGHPGTTTLYSLALIISAVGAGGMALGQFSGPDDFVSAAFANPEIVFLPARLVMVACGVGCVLLTYLLGKRLWGSGTGLIAAAILSVNALHIENSQIIRTDVQASVFMLLCALQSLAIYKQGRPRDYILAGLFAGLAAATKWPAAAIVLSPLCAGLYRARLHPNEFPLLLGLAVAAAASLLATSPFLLLDYATLLRDLAGEARPVHPGATARGFVGNNIDYIRGPLWRSFGTLGLSLLALGLVGAIARDRRWMIAVAPGFLLFAALISSQHLIWDRWLVPLLPFLALSAAWAVRALARALKRLARPRARLARVAIGTLVLPLLLLPMLFAARTMAAERKHDTRQVASAWIRAHVPPNSSIVVEHGALDLLAEGWDIRFPLGAAGCVDARRALAGKLSAAEVERNRTGRAIVDIGHVAPALLDTCRAEFAVISHWARYRAAPKPYSDQIQRYRDLTAGSGLAARIVTRPGEIGGPTVYIFRLARSRTPA